MEGLLKNLAAGVSNETVRVCSPAEYLEANGEAEEGRGFLLTEEVVEAIDRPRGRTISTGGRVGGDCMGGGEAGGSDGFEAEGVSG